MRSIHERRLGRRAAVGALVGLVPGCRQTGSSKTGGKLTLAIGGQPNLVYTPATLAESLGHYRTENLDVALVDTSGGSKALQALMGGSEDVVCGFYDHTIQMAAEGKKIKAFVVLSTSYAEAIVVAPTATHRISKLEDLRGAKIGVTAPGSSTHFFVNYVLGQRGIKPDEFTVVGTGSGQSRISALEYGKVDAGVLLEPSITYLSRRHAGLKIFADTRTPEGSKAVLGSSLYPTAVLYSTKPWLEEHAEAAGTLARAMTKTLQWIAAHSPDEIAQAMPESLRIDTEPGVYAEAIRNTKEIFSKDGLMPRDGAEAVLRVMQTVDEKVRGARITLADTYTNDLVPHA